MTLDPALLAVLQCPRCAGPLVAARAGLECRSCQVDFPSIGKVPCLLPEPQRALGEWRREVQRFVELLEKQVETLDQELARFDLLPTTRQRLERLRAENAKDGGWLVDLFSAAGLPPDRHAKASGRDFTLVLYYEQILRDWGWNGGAHEENRDAAALVAAKIEEIDEVGAGGRLGRVLVLGAGASRLAYDVHMRFAPTLTVALDHDPLLVLAAQQVMFGGGLTLTEFPSDPVSLEQVAVEHTLRAPQGAPERFFLVAADAFHAPLRPGAFDTIITPWFIDIVPVDPRETIAIIHRLLAPGGRWINHGPLSYPQEHKHGQRYSLQELEQLIRLAAFELGPVTRTSIDYLHSPVNTRWKKMQVFSFAARKLDPAELAAAPGSEPPAWLLFTHLPVPRFPGLDGYTPEHPMLAYLVKLIDGRRTPVELAARVIADHGARPDTAIEGTRAMLGVLYRAVKEAR